MLPFFSYKKQYFVCLAIFFLFLFTTVQARIPSFVPPVYNYTSTIYNAENQNWAIAQGKDGVIYIGNNKGLLTFDGVNWNLYRLPNNLGIKSIFIDKNRNPERIYVGSFEEFGFFERNAANRFIYHSFKPLVKNYQFHNDEVWTIQQLNDTLFFQTFSSYFVYNEKWPEIKYFKSDPAPLYFFSIKDTLYAQYINEHFYRYNGNDFELLLTHEQLKNDEIVSVQPFGKNLLLFSSKSGILEYSIHSNTLSEWKTAVDKELKRARINRVVSIADSIYIIGTLSDGIFVLDMKGQLNYHLNRNNGLNNNTVLGLFCDNENNVWVALDNGVAYVQTKSPISFFEPVDIQIGLVEDLLIDNHTFYLATNQGIYKYSETLDKIIALPGFEIQSWFIRKFNDQIIIGNNEGTSFLKDDKNIPVINSSGGGMDIKAVNLYGRDLLLESTYSDLQMFNQINGQWVFSHKLDNFSDLINRIEVDHTGNVWAGHMYKGVYRLRIDEQLQKIVEKEYFSTLDSLQNYPNPIRVMKLRGRIIFADGHAFYTYDDIAQKITLFDQLNQDLSELADTHRVVMVNDSLCWFVRNNEYSLIRYKDGHYKIQEKIPFSILNNPPNMGRGNVYVDDNGISYFCLNGGIGKYVPVKKTDQKMWPRFALSWVSCYNRKSNQVTYLPLTKKNAISYKNNNLTFQFQYPDYSRKPIKIECLLEDYDSEWMTLPPDLSVNYANLPSGNYMLKARVISEDGRELSQYTFPFQITTPWYKTGWAILFYVLAFMMLTGWIINQYLNTVIRRKNKAFAQREKERIAQVERQEKIITALKNEQLQADLTHKSKELANATMLIINHEEFLNSLKKEIQHNILSGKIQRTQGNELIKMIESNFSEKDEWTVFQDNFDLIHENFFRKLKERYPSLTSSDLRLCALLRLNYSSKDIAKMLNLSIRGVEAARYRLRKKLALEEKDDLIAFMINFK
ncbi:triple tyrosine motif-containing protein [Anaerorudis cellulosivorans]|uniref:triple tyrosine motif-containing protein n=1 Tax=Anaerorudis cellulosivorans TaxID=3397862 RepID=UPI00221FE6E1|nr:triple tyrosine motif-containing protein [Seramator thermalis]MCW1735948.1 hypothetical protein [Seramator thermalis]